jgi:WD40 repeat protein/DNA-binding MarR family transcriptional regulator
MDAENALGLLDRLLQGQKLKDIQELVFRYTWQGWTYPKIAEHLGYDTSHIRDVGSRLWQQLSHILGEDISKNTVQSVLRRRSQQDLTNSLPETLQPSTFDAEPVANPIANTHQYWAEAIDVSRFYGRHQELAQLTQWIITDHCRLIAVLGMGGIGKTTLTAKLAQQLAGGREMLWVQATRAGADDPPPLPSPCFEFVIWQSLRNAPSVEETLTRVLSILSDQQQTQLPTTFEAQLAQLMQHLRRSRCLLILDNVEAILENGSGTKSLVGVQAGQYRAGYNGYDDLLRQVGAEQHQSCVVLTSREKPKTLALLEGETLPVRSFLLPGLSGGDAQNILSAGGCVCDSDAELVDLTVRYAGNPLALKIVATTVRELFDGRIAGFLEQGAIAFGDISALLEEQYQRLSVLEKQVMAWLAINREWVSLAELREDLFPSLPQSKLLETLQSLERRSLIEKSTGQFTLQPVVMEYVTEQLIERVCEALSLRAKRGNVENAEGKIWNANIGESILNSHFSILNCHALMKATAKDYIRESQIHQIVKPVLNHLLNTFGNRAAIINHCVQILSKLRYEAPQEPGYAAGNIFNLLCQLQVDLTGYDFSELALWQADLRNVTLHRVNLAQTNLMKTAFREMLAIVVTVAFSPDGQLLATGGMDRQVRLWRVADGRNLLTLQGHRGWVWSVAFSPDGRTLASGSDDGTIKQWSLDRGHCIQTLSSHSGPIWSVAFSPDGYTLASSSEDQTIKLWNLDSGDCYQTLKGHSNWVRSVAFSPRSSTALNQGARGILASGSDDQTIKLWDLETGQCYQTLQGHTSRVWVVAFNPDGTQLASGSSDHSVKLWDVVRGQCLRTFEGHSNWVRSLAFDPAGSMIASGSEDQTIRLWQVNTGHCHRILRGHTGWVRALAFSPMPQHTPEQEEPGWLLASASGDHTIKLWDAALGRCDKTLHGYTNRVLSVAFNPDEQRLVSSHDDGNIRVWDLTTGECCQTLRHTGSVSCVAIAADGNMLASSGSNQKIRLWSLDKVPHKIPPGVAKSSHQDLEDTSSRHYQTLQGHNSRIWSVAFDPAGTLLASGSEDRLLKIWDTHTGRCLETFEGHTAWICGVAFSPIASDPSHPGSSGTILASASYDGTIKLWDLATRQCIRSLEGHHNWVWAVAFSPDGQAIASGSGDHTVKLWNPYTGECLQTLHGHTSRVWSVAFSPDGRTLATASSDQTVKLWDLATGECCGTLEEHENIVWSVAFSPDGEILASGSHDETIKLWQVKTGQCLRTLSVDRPYEGMSITEAIGLTEAQKITLYALGALKGVPA